MLHHVSVGTNDLSAARKFYSATMSVLGFRLLQSSETGLDYGTSTLVFSAMKPVNDQAATAGNGVHIAFIADKRAMVDEWYEAALANGGSGDGAPGVRPNYDPNYYAAFVRDPDGNKLELFTFASDEIR